MLNPKMVEEIEKEITRAKKLGRKKSMFHFQVLKHYEELKAEGLKGKSAEDFCVAVGMTPSYKSELSGMMNLAEVMRQENHCVCRSSK